MGRDSSTGGLPPVRQASSPGKRIVYATPRPNSMGPCTHPVDDFRMSILRVNRASCWNGTHGSGFGRYGAAPSSWGARTCSMGPRAHRGRHVTLQSADGQARLMSELESISVEGGEVRREKFKPWADRPSESFIA
mmetsp:Transcript_43117/g.93931  ORF Transcript_43117/g.93931 Transcript_43117/m.93931 type:complete len:135 (+) Transcript_43117:107-511(+)